MRGYFGARAFFNVFGLWKTTEYRGLCCFLNTPFLTALAVFAALSLLLSAQRCIRERENAYRQQRLGAQAILSP